MWKPIVAVGLGLVALGALLVPLPGPGYLVLTAGVVVVAAGVTLRQARADRP